MTWRRPELGILVLGGKGAHMRRVPDEALEAEKRLGVSAERIKRASKLAARADSSFLQDGYELYHHAVIVTETGRLVVVQQGMNRDRRMARRYHVAREEIEEPHSAVLGSPGGTILNATARESREARKVYLEIVQQGARKIVRDIEAANTQIRGTRTILHYIAPQREPSHKQPARAPYYRPIPVTPQLRKALEDLERWSPASEEELALAPGLGPKVVRALALIADIVYGVPTSSRDPVVLPLNPFAYAFAVGGKDRVPYPFQPTIAMRAVSFLREALEEIRVGEKLRAKALERLRRLARGLAGLEG